MNVRQSLIAFASLSAAFVALGASTCITSDPQGHTVNGGTPLPGTVSTADSTVAIVADGISQTLAVSSSPSDCDGVDKSFAQFGPSQIDCRPRGAILIVR